ncbi:MAG: peptidylprolyl isomerase [Thermoanaerobaculales bacterium]|nr:peptidylprolyl isomerase [Thermoanaerobaculales bacterium]
MRSRDGFSVMVLLVAIAAASVALADRMEEIAVLVNGEPVYTWELKLLVPQIETEMKAQGLETRGTDLVRTTLGRAVDSELLAQAAQKRGFTVNEQRVNDKMRRLADGAGGPAALEAELIRSGVTYEQLRSSVVEADLVQTFVETVVAPTIVISDDEVAAFYEANQEMFRGPDRIHARHILFLVAPDASAEQREAAQRRAEAARQRALAGEDFAALAVELSEGPDAERGGDLGFTARGQMVEEFDDAVWQLEPGAISDVVSSRRGYHVIRVEEIRAGAVVPLDEAREPVTDLLRQQRLAEALRTLLGELRAEAEIREPSS